MRWEAVVDAPQHIVEGLKAIDPSAELLYLAQGKWALVARPSGVNLWPRRRIGLNILRQMRRKGVVDPVTERTAMLTAEGYGVILIQAWPHAPTSDLVEWFREADWASRHDMDARMDVHEAESDGRAWEDRMTQRFRDYNESEGRSIYRHVYKGRHTVS